MTDPRGIPCLFMRGGTSRGAFLHARDLPDDPEVRDRAIAAMYGSPDYRQIDGIGGGDPLTSKVAVIDASDRDDADVTYTFGQVGITTREVFWVGNCGNMLAGVGPFAIHTGLILATEPVTRVRILNVNTDTVITAEVPVAGGEVVEDGDLRIAGVPGAGAPIALDFGGCAGAVTSELLPTGSTRENVTLPDGTRVDVSIVDASTPFVFVAASDLNMSGIEDPETIQQDEGLLDKLELIRATAARMIGLVADVESATRQSPSIPRVSVVSPASSYRTGEGFGVSSEDVNLVARQMSMQRPHKTYAVTGTVCTAVAANIAGTVVHDVARQSGGAVHIGHPGGIISAEVEVDHGPPPAVKRACVLRTARLLMDGNVRIPSSAAPMPPAGSGWCVP